MQKYHKIPTVFKRDKANGYKTLLKGQFSLPEFEYLQNATWVFTEKVNGTNIRINFTPDSLCFILGKTDKAQLPTPLINRLETIFLPLVSRVVEAFGDNHLCLYGEGYGPKINKGKKYSVNHDFVLFDVTINEQYQPRANVETIAITLGLDIVPILGKGSLWDMYELVNKGFPSQWGDFTAEGIVARPEVELQSRSGQRIITKLKFKDFRR